MIIYPDENYNSWISEDDADEYFENRLNADVWDTANKEAALMTAFNSLNELDLNIEYEDEAEGDLTLSSDYTDVEAAKILDCMKRAQGEQALHELKNDLDAQAISGFSFGGMLSVKIPANQTPPSRYSERALSILRPYTVTRTVTRTR